MKPKRKRRVFVQKMLFGEDEMRYVEQSCRRTAYTDYWQGAADMMLAMLSQLPRERSAMRNLNRQYMQAVCKCILRDREALTRFRNGAAFRFYVERDEYGEIKNVKARI